jgi:small-conductance mechanosensitive channel
MTAWLASAGIVGITVDFTAKDTLLNLFSGVFILADVPYKVAVAYGSDVDQIRAIMLDIAQEEPQVCTSPEPKVRFRTFGASSFDFYTPQGGTKKSER